MSLEFSPGFGAVPDEHSLYPFVAPLVAGRGTYHRLDGTAFLIAPGWALTAAHVLIEQFVAFDPEFKREQLRGRVSGHCPVPIQMAMIRPAGRPRMIKVKRSYFRLPGDLALLRLDDSALDWNSFGKFPILRLAPPRVGERISALGMPRSGALNTGDRKALLDLWPRLSEGVVQEVHAERRDSVSLNFPCFRTDAKVLGGMSGSPVVDGAGCICGVVATSYDVRPEEAPISYMSTIWPFTVISTLKESEVEEQPGAFGWDLIQSGLCRATDRHRIRLNARTSTGCSVSLLGDGPVVDPSAAA